MEEKPTDERPHDAPPATGADLVRFARRYVRKQAASVVANEAGTRSGENSDALHDMRVAARRLRAAIAVFEDHLPGRKRKTVARGLRRLTRALCAPREWDVHAANLAALVAGLTREGSLAATEFVLELVDRRRTAERERMIRRLDRLDVDTLTRRVRRLFKRLEIPVSPGGAALDVLAPRVHVAFDALPALVETETPDAMHAMRVAVKRLRYAVEAFEPLFPPDRHDEFLKLLKSFQDVLGRHHDMVLLEQLLVQTLSWLSRNGRRTLADGLLTPLDRTRADARAQFSEFVRLAGGWSADGLISRIKTDVEP